MALTNDKFAQKQAQLIERTASALNISQEVAVELLSTPRKQSLRLNTLAGTIAALHQEVAALGIQHEAVAWLPEGLFISDDIEKVRDSTGAENGHFYIQNAASWLPVVALDAQPGETVLDMCAAPGGKTSHIAAQAHNQAVITANDNSRPRLHKLQRNLERLGVQNTTYALYDATRLSFVLEQASFDKILLDAPCSGEGMMTLSNKRDFESWSVAHIKRLQKIQKKLIVQAWQLLKPGGTLIYSTCTIAPEENEAVIDYLLRHNDDIEVDDLGYLAAQLKNTVPTVEAWNNKSYDPRVGRALRLKPSPSIEAFFVIKLRKRSS